MSPVVLQAVENVKDNEGAKEDEAEKTGEVQLRSSIVSGVHIMCRVATYRSGSAIHMCGLLGRSCACLLSHC